MFPLLSYTACACAAALAAFGDPAWWRTRASASRDVACRSRKSVGAARSTASRAALGLGRFTHLRLDLRTCDPPHHLGDDVVLPGVGLGVGRECLRVAEVALLDEHGREIGGQGWPEVHVAHLHEHVVTG